MWIGLNWKYLDGATLITSKGDNDRDNKSKIETFLLTLGQLPPWHTVWEPNGERGQWRIGKNGPKSGHPWTLGDSASRIMSAWQHCFTQPDIQSGWLAYISTLAAPQWRERQLLFGQLPNFFPSIFFYPGQQTQLGWWCSVSGAWVMINKET